MKLTMFLVLNFSNLPLFENYKNIEVFEKLF